MRCLGWVRRAGGEDLPMVYWEDSETEVGFLWDSGTKSRDGGKGSGKEGLCEQGGLAAWGRGLAPTGVSSRDPYIGPRSEKPGSWGCPPVVEPVL